MLYDGRNLDTFDLPSLRRKIGTVTQNAGLFQGDIYSNIVITAPELVMLLDFLCTGAHIFVLHLELTLQADRLGLLNRETLRRKS